MSKAIGHKLQALVAVPQAAVASALTSTVLMPTTPAKNVLAV
jgi:hypothetical protein